MEVPHDADIFGRGERMTEEEMLEAESFWCENCCHFDKDHIGPDAMAPCKITNTLAYCEESGKDCPFFNVPAADVVEVVRCRDCTGYNGSGYCRRLAVSAYDNDFCSYGERKEQG